MAIGYITTMANYSEAVVDALNNSPPPSHRSPVRQGSQWEPPKYTSMRAWMFMNYLLLALLLALPALIIIAVTR